MLPAVRETLEQLAVTYEIVVMDGHSTDGTVDVATEHGARALVQFKPGYAAAFTEAIEAARGEYIICLDADSPHSPKALPQLWHARDKAEVVIASRFVSGGSLGGPLYRRALSWFLSALSRRALSLPVLDVSSGYRLYHKRIFTGKTYASSNFEILLEVLVKAVNDAYGFFEIPLHYDSRAVGKSR